MEPERRTFEFPAALPGAAHRVSADPQWGHLVSGAMTVVCGGGRGRVTAGEAFHIPPFCIVRQDAGTEAGCVVAARASGAGAAGGGPDGAVETTFIVQDYLERWESGSRLAADTLPAMLDLPYGAGPWERLDLFPAAGKTPAPLVVFLHGGGWSLPQVTKDIHRFPALAFTSEGISFATLDYPLIPGATMDEIVASVAGAILYLRRNAGNHGIDPDAMYLVGHSAGGHLVAALLSLDWRSLDPGVPATPFLGGCAISGIFELKNEWIATWDDIPPFTADEVRRHSPLFNVPQTSSPLLLTAGGVDDPEFHRQIDDYARAWSAAGLDVGILDLPGLHHMNEILELARTESPLFRAIVAAVRGLDAMGFAHAGGDESTPAEQGGTRGPRMQRWGGMVVSFERGAAGNDVLARCRKAPGTACDRLHWGYVSQGRFRVTYPDHVEEFGAGQAYSLARGHRLAFLADCEVVDFSPEEEPWE